MFALIKKDLYIQRYFFILSLAAEIVLLFLFVIQNYSSFKSILYFLIHGVALFYGFACCFRTMGLEEKNKSLLFIKSLPVSTAEIVFAKFSVNFILVLLNLIILVILYAILQKATGQAADINLLKLLVGISYQLLNAAFFIAVAFIFSVEWGIWVPFALLFLILNIVINLRSILQNETIGPILVFIINHEFLQIFILMALTALLIGLSLRSMNKKLVFG